MIPDVILSTSLICIYKNAEGQLDLSLDRLKISFCLFSHIFLFGCQCSKSKRVINCLCDWKKKQPQTQLNFLGIFVFNCLLAGVQDECYSESGYNIEVSI